MKMSFVIAMTMIASSSWAGRRVYIIPGLYGVGASCFLRDLAENAGYDPVVVRSPSEIARARERGDGPIIAHSSGNIAALRAGVVPDVDIGAVRDTGARIRISGSRDIFTRQQCGDYLIEGAGHLTVTSDCRTARLLRRLLGD